MKGENLGNITTFLMNSKKAMVSESVSSAHDFLNTPKNIHIKTSLKAVITLSRWQEY